MSMEMKEIRDLSLSNYTVYKALSAGYEWITPKMTLQTRIMLKKFGFFNIFNQPEYLNFIGTELLNMPYIENEEGEFNFIIPVFLETKEEDIVRMNTIGLINEKTIAPIQNNDRIAFSNTTKFIVYNDKIEVNDDAELNDVNQINIIINTVSVFLLQIYKKGLSL